MASLKALRKRVSSVKSTQQITKAMKMVAAAKLRRAQSAAIAARPYAEKLETMVGHLLQVLDEDAHPLLRKPETEQRALVLVVTSDRGLCGAYNGSLMRQVEAFARERTEQLTFESIGRKGDEYLRRRQRTMRDKLAMPSPAESGSLARQVAQAASALFLEGEVDAVYLIYNAFRSTLSQVPTIERLLPLEHNATDGHENVETDYLFEPDAQTIVNHLLPRLVEVRVLHALLEAGASEQAARMAAMDAATRNASEMIDRLTLEMNRARQAAITKELMEIIGGAEALNG